MYLALARKYRPQDFTQVIGQDPIIKTLANALAAERIHHAYLFCGARGVGKTSLARIFAKSINCEKGPTLTPCQKCDSCESITRGNAMDVIEIDAASNTGIDDIRGLREQVKYRPGTGRYKIFIIDEVHMLSTAAFNGLLKTLEEPPDYVIFILATTEPHDIPVTILSRCLKFDFRKLGTEVLIKHLETILKQEDIQAEAGAVRVVVECAQGSVRDALSLLDQAIGGREGQITESGVRKTLGLGERLLTHGVFKSLVGADLNTAISELVQVDALGLDLKVFAEDVLSSYRHLILFKSTGKMPTEVSPSEVEFYSGLATGCDVSLLLAQYQILFQGLSDLTRTEFQKTALEITFVKMAHAGQMIGLTDLVANLMERRAVKPAPGATQRPVVSNRHEAAATAAVEETKKAGVAESPVAQSWDELVKVVKTIKPPLGACLYDAVPLAYSDSRIEVGYPKDSNSRKMLIERKQVMDEILQQHFGRPVEFVVSEIEGGEKKKF